MAIKTFTAGSVLTASDTNTYLANSGLVYIASGTATSGSIIDILGCFTSTYDSYKVVISDLRTTGGVTDVNLQLLVGSTPNASNFIFAVNRVDYAAGTVGAYRASSQGTMIGGICSSNSLGYEINISQPKLPRYTSFSGVAHDSRGTSGYFAIGFSGQLENSTQYDGLRINIGGSTFANANVRVYGYRQA